MEVGGQAADQIVRTEIQLTEEAIKLLASGSKNLAAFLLALAKDNKKVMGKTNMGRLLQDTRELKFFQIEEKDWTKFTQYAKEFGVLYSGVKKKNQEDGLITLVSNEGYTSQMNYVLERMGYPIPEKQQEEQPTKKAAPRAPRENSSQERGSGLTQPQTKQPVRKENRLSKASWPRWNMPAKGRAIQSAHISRPDRRLKIGQY